MQLVTRILFSFWFEAPPLSPPLPRLIVTHKSALWTHLVLLSTGRLKGGNRLAQGKASAAPWVPVLTKPHKKEVICFWPRAPLRAYRPPLCPGLNYCGLSGLWHRMSPMSRNKGMTHDPLPRRNLQGSICRALWHCLSPGYQGSPCEKL